MIEKPSKHLHQLTWLRGFAAFLVVVTHTITATNVTYTDADQATIFAFARAFYLGGFGVTLFFILSGATLYLSCNGNIPSVLKFFVKRFFRIWPAFIVSLIAYMAFALIFRAYYPEPQGHWIEKQFLSDYSLYDIVAYITLTSNVHGTYGLFNNAYWSLPVEFQYYLIFPFILLSLNRFGVSGPIVIGLGLIVIHMVFDVPENSSAFFRLGYSFCGGVLIGHLYTRTSFRLPTVISVPALLIAYSMIWMLTENVIPLPRLPFLKQIYNWDVLIGLVFVSVCTFSTLSLPRILREWMELYGTVSYSTYLYHNLVIGALTLIVINSNINNGLVRYMFILIGTLFITHVLALVSYSWVESPSILLARKLTTKK